MLTYEQAVEVLEYDPVTGDIKWHGKANPRFVGGKAGSLNKDGYVDISYRYNRMYGHRVAWLLSYGEWPAGHIDHINGNPSDNRISNLRLVDNEANHRNMKQHKGNSSGVTGVYWSKRAKKWQAYICVKGKQIYLGVFAELEEARIARKEAEIEYGFHKNHGRISRSN